MTTKSALLNSLEKYIARVDEHVSNQLKKHGRYAMYQSTAHYINERTLSVLIADLIEQETDGNDSELMQTTKQFVADSH